MTAPAAEYGRLVSELVAASRRHEITVTAAAQSYMDGIVIVAQDTAAATRTEQACAEVVASREAGVAAVDQEAERVWGELVSGRRWWMRRVGPLPAPAGGPVEGDADALLASAADRIARSRRGAQRLPVVLLLSLVLVGGLLAAAPALVASAAPHVYWLKWSCLVVAPIVGIPFAAAWVDYWAGSRLTRAALALTFFGGIAATLAIALAL